MEPGTGAVIGLVKAQAAKKGIDRFLAAIESLVSNPIRRKIRTKRAEKSIGELYQKIKDIRNVKTLLSPEKAVDLQSFYYPTAVSFGGKSRYVRDVDQLGETNHCVIKGTAGQGKSIFLRYLTSREMQKGDRWPIFIELRKVSGSKDSGLLESIMREIKRLRIDIDDDTFAILAKNGRFTFFLNAFDEVEPHSQNSAYDQIERLSREYPRCKIIVSSRFESLITASAYFENISMMELGKNDYVHVMRRMARDDELVESIAEGVKNSSYKVTDILTSPLMVALLVVRYRIDQTIPENAVSFYNDLFDLLIQRHDRSKGWSGRTRASALSDAKLEELFQCTCFNTRKIPQAVYPRKVITSSVAQAVDTLDLQVEADDVLLDFTDITCLLLKEGAEYHFVHKTVQEFFSARFVSDQPDEVAEIFYRGLPERWQYWSQEISFLATLDRHRYFKFFLLPDIDNVRFDFSNNDYKTLLQQIECDCWTFPRSGGQIGFSSMVFIPKYDSVINFSLSGRLARKLNDLVDRRESLVIDSLVKDGLLDQKYSSAYDEQRKKSLNSSIDASVLLHSKSLKSEILDILKSCHMELRRERSYVIKKINQTEKRKKVLSWD
ncbi:MAG: NACHT domain-containing protein [Planctomycetota bacterium]